MWLGESNIREGLGDPTREEKVLERAETNLGATTRYSCGKA